MCAADVLSLLFSKNFTLRLSVEFDHVLVASHDVEICVVSRIITLFFLREISLSAKVLKNVFLLVKLN